MDRDVTAFRERFNAYKNGKSVSEIYDAGLPKYKNGTGGDVPAYQQFVEEMGPVLFRQIVAQGVKNPEKAYRNMITHLAYESNYGTSSVARNLNNYGGVGWNGKTYTTYKDKADFAKNYVRLMNSRYKNVITADTLLDYAKGLKGLGYYEDSLENYARNLTGMKSFAKALDSHIANNPDLYTVVSGKPMSQTTAAELHAASLFEPVPVVIHSDYPINNPSPSSISSWNNPTSPAFNTSELYARRATNNINNVVQDILFNDKDVSDALKDNLSKNVFGGKRLGFKNGKLPGYKDGIPTKVGEYNVYPSAVGASELNVTVPEVTVTGTDRRPLYQRYDAENSTYDPDAIRNFTDFAPIVGDVGLGLDAYNAFKNLNYALAGILGGLLLLPNALENTGKYTYRTLRHLGVSQDFAKDLLQNGEAAWKRFKNLDIFDRLRGVKYTDNVYHGSKKVFDINHARPYSPVGMDTGFHMGSSPTPAYSRANGLLGGAMYSGKLKLKEDPFEIRDLGRWSHEEIYNEAHNNPELKKYLESKGINIDEVHKIGQELDKEYFNAFADQQQKYLKEHNGFLSDLYLADLFKKKNVSFKYKNDYETFKDVPEYSYNIYNPDNVVWNRPFRFSEKSADLSKLRDLGFNTNIMYRVLEDFPRYRLPGFKNGKSSIHINPANRGKFNATKKRTGKTTEQLAHSSNPLTRKRAIFALNARKWHH